MKSLKYVSVLLLSLFVISNTFVGCVAADSSDDNTMNVKVGDLFELKLPSYSKVTGKKYYWSPTLDNEHILAYNNMDTDAWCFKALKKGKTTMIMQLYEIDTNINTTKLIKTVTYTINIK